jgi:two-component system phosphate regulon sensor histidine kinase PhoR
MKRKIFLSLLMMGVSCMLILTGIFTWLFHSYTESHAEDDLDLSLRTVSAGMNESHRPIEFLQNLGFDTPYIRLTWISQDGSVLYDSNYDKDKMENHIDRPEVKDALEYGKGKAVRDSTTVSENLLYKAVRMPDGSILRAGIRQRNIYGHWASMAPYFLVFLLVAFFICLWASRKLSVDLLYPLRHAVHLISHVRQSGPAEINAIDEKEIENIDSEVRPLVRKIADLAVALSASFEQVKRQRNMVNLILENMQEAVILTDGSYKILTANKSAVELLHEKSEPRVKEKNLSFLLPEVSWPTVGPVPPAGTIDTEKIKRDGIIFAVTRQPIYLEREFYGFLFIASDITEMEEREQLRREFTSNVSHELKTPLTSISGFSEVLKEKLFQNDDDVAHFGNLIYKESHRLLELIEEILHLGRIEEKRIKVNMVPVRLDEVTRDIVAFMDPVLEDKEVKVHLDLAETTMIGDPGLLRECFMNLIDNAIKYNHQGGHIYVTVKDEGNQAVYTVRDTGIGIPKGEQKRIFERFYRVDSSRSKAIKGTGIGLAVVKHIIDIHHGTITVESEVGDGTTFIIRFPKGETKQEAAAQP